MGRNAEYEPEMTSQNRSRGQENEDMSCVKNESMMLPFTSVNLSWKKNVDVHQSIRVIAAYLLELLSLEKIYLFFLCGHNKLELFGYKSYLFNLYL
jgi:hypothetical protein